MRKTAIVTAIILAAAARLPAQLTLIEEAPVIPSGRIAAIGGPHVAVADDLTTLFLNPAGFRAAGPQMSLAEVTLGLAGPIFSITDLVMQVMNGTSIATLMDMQSVQQLFNGLYAAGAVNGPIAFGYVGNGLGFGIFNTTDLKFSTVGTIPTLTASLVETMSFEGGYAFRIPIPEEVGMTLDLGFMLKAFVRGEIGLSENILTIMGLLMSPSIATFMGQAFALDVGAGLDLGIRYSWADVLTIGIVGRNLPTFTMRNSYASLASFLAAGAPATEYGYVPIDLSAGLMFSPSLGFFDRFISKVKFFADYGDILDFITHPATARNPFLHIGAGMELTLLEILSLRGGFYDGYFSAGVGIDLAFVRLDLSTFGRELSGEPGLRPVYNLLIGLLFRI